MSIQNELQVHVAHLRYSNVCPVGGLTTPNLRSAVPPPLAANNPAPSPTASSSPFPDATFRARDSSNEDNISDFDVCDYSFSFNSLDDSNAQSGSLHSGCTYFYALDSSDQVARHSLADLTPVVEEYDAEFDYYVTYITKIISLIIDGQYMLGKASTTQSMLIPVFCQGMNCTNVDSSFQASVIADINTARF